MSIVRHMSISWVMAAAVVLVTAACQATSGPAPTPAVPTPEPPNVEATVEAAVAATVAARPTLAPPTLAVLATATRVPPTVPPAPTATPLPKEDPVALTGSGDVQTKQFALRGGNYSVAWKGHDATSSRIGCVLYGYLMSPGTDRSVQSFSGSSREGADNSGTTEWYSVRNGSYYLKMGTTCAPWAVAIVPQGDEPVTALPDVQTAPPPSSGSASPNGSAAAQKWQVTPKAFDEIPTSLVSNEYGVTRQQNPTGKFVRVTFSLKNLQNRSAYVTGGDFELVDSQNRTYETDFQTRQVQGSTSQPFDHSNIAPGAAVVLTLTFDVARDANGLTLRLS